MLARVIQLGSKESGLSTDCDNAGLWVVQEKQDDVWVTVSEAMEHDEAFDFMKAWIEVCDI
jgi:hypothetical protein